MIALLLLMPALAPTDVDLTFVPLSQDVPPGCIAEVDVVLSADSPVFVSAVDIILDWDPSKLQFIQAVPSAEDWFVAAFLNDPDGINNDVTDGSALFTALINPANPLLLPPDATVATFIFQVIDDGVVTMLPNLGVFGHTQVIGTLPGEILTGTLSLPAIITATDVVSIESLRLGTPPNPNVFLPGQTSGPIIGQVWDPVVDHTSFFPGALFDLVAITSGPIPVDIPSIYGTFLCDLTGALIFKKKPAGVPFTIFIPNDCTLLGVSVCTQAFSVDALGGLLFTNAIDITIGTI